MNVVLSIDHIVRDPDKHGGKPHIAGKGLTVQYIAELYKLDYTVDDLVEGFDLTPGQVHAALSYYFDHQAEIDEAIRESRAAAQAALQASDAQSAEAFRQLIDSRKANR